MSTLKDRAHELLDEHLTTLDDLEIAQQNPHLTHTHLAKTKTQDMATCNAAIAAGRTPTQLKRPGQPRGTHRPHVCTVASQRDTTDAKGD